MPAFRFVFWSSALATADRTSFASGVANFWGSRSRIASACSTPLPRIWSAMRRALRALIRELLSFALTAMATSPPPARP